MKNEIRFYINIFFRKFHYFLLVFLLVGAASLTLANILPPVYVSRTTLLLESSQIPTALAAPTVTTGAIEELQIVERRLMTRNNLLDIARELGVFGDIAEMTTDQIVKEMRQATRIRRTTGRAQATLMTIEFESTSGAIAANVVTRYVTIVLQENAESRAGRAGDTLDFFVSEEKRLASELEVQSAAIVKFQNQNSGTLPNSLAFRLNQQTVLQQRLSTVERDIASLSEQRRRLVEIFNATGNVANSNAVPLTPEQQVLSTLKDDLRRALAVYSSENPKIKLIQAQIAQQESVVNAQGAANPNSAQGPLTVLDINLADIDARLDLLENEGQKIIEQLAALIKSIDKTAEIDIVLTALNREYGNTQRQYDATVDRQSRAAAAERIELLSKGRRISVLTPASAPQEPEGPNRLLIGGGGMVFGAVLGVALIFLLELLNNSIRRPSDIVRQLGITPMATVPYFRTPFELVLRRVTILAMIALIIVGVPAALVAVDTYYMPLDLLYQKVAEKFTELI